MSENLRKAWNGPAVAGDTHLRIPFAEADRIEAGTVRIEPESPPDRSMAGGAVPFDVTRNARFERLPGGLTVPQDEPGLGIVESRAPQAAPGIEPGLRVTTRTELLVVVAIGAGGLPGIGCRRMADQESRGMKVSAAGRPRQIGAVTGQTVCLCVTGRAGTRRCIGFAGVLLLPEAGVRSRRTAHDLGARAPCRSGLLHQRDGLGQRHSLVAGRAARLGVASGAALGSPERHATMARQPACGSVGSRSPESESVDQGTLVRSQRLNRGNLGGIDVTPDAEVPRVTGRTTRSDGPPTPGRGDLGELRVSTTEPETRSLVPGRNREPADRFPGQGPGLGERDVTRPALGIGGCEMIAPGDVTADAPGDLTPDDHATTLGTEMTLLAANRVRGRGAMALVGESEIRRRRCGRRAPGNAPLDRPVMTRSTTSRRGPEGGIRVSCPLMAGDAGAGEEVEVPGVIEGLPLSPGPCGDRPCQEHQDSGRAERASYQV